MKVKIYIGYVLIVIVGLLLGVFLKRTLAAIWPRPAIFVEPMFVDFGEVGTAQVYTAVFTVENKGRAPLEVILLKANCMCTVAEMCESPILPGKKSSIKARIKAPDVENHFGSEFAIKTNDPRHREITLKMHGTAVSVLNIAPLNLLLGDVHVKDLPLTKRIVIRPGRLARPGMLESLDVKCDHPGLDLSVTKDTNEVIVDVGLRTDVPIGVVRTNITLMIENFNNYTLRIPVVSQIRGDYDIRPASLFFGKVKADTSVTKECVITPFGVGDMLELVSDESEMPNSPLEVEIGRSTGRAFVRGTFTAGIQESVFERTLKFKLTPKDGSLPQYLQIPAIAITGRSGSKSKPIAKKQDY